MPRADGALVRPALADLLFAPPAAARARLEQLRERGLSGVTIALAGQWRVAPALRARIEAAANDDERAQLRRLSAIAAAQSGLTVHRSRTVLGALRAADIDAVAIKGVALIAQLYGNDAAARMIADLDIVVRETDYRRAERVLEDAGFVSMSPEFERHVASIAASMRLHNFARTFEHDGFQVDVHWRFGVQPPAALGVEAVLAHAETIALRGTPVRVAAPLDAMLVTVHHALRGYFTAQSTLKDAADLAAWWTRAPERWDLTELIAAARESDLATSLFALWSIVAQRDPAHACGAGVRALRAALPPSGVREAGRLLQFFESQLRAGDYAPRTVEVYAFPEIWRRARARPRVAASGAAARPTTPRRPLHLRAAGFAGDLLRVAWQVCNVRRIPAYRAIAQAQGRFH
ncbi:MAG: nucleotidyltransferase family protein [Candidatus Velthaea sp.]